MDEEGNWYGTNSNSNGEMSVGFTCACEAFSLERCHAAHTSGRHSLAKRPILDVARREHAGNAGRRAVRSSQDIAILVHRKLALEDRCDWVATDSNEDAIDRKRCGAPGLDTAEPDCIQNFGSPAPRISSAT